MADAKMLATARETLWVDFFGGWSDSDLAFLSRYAGQRTGTPNRGEIFDWLGVRTNIRHHGWLDRPESEIIDLPAIPVPSDMIHAEAIEYISLLLALERARDAGRKSLAVVELGASYGPWVTTAGVMAQRLGFESVELVAVEASAQMIPEILDHAALNGIGTANNQKIQAIHAAVYTQEQELYFPKVNVSDDNGAQVSAGPEKKDYRGLEVSYDRVSGITLRKIYERFELIDFTHLDLQGAEELLLQDEDFLAVLTAKTSTFFLATQSRFIEGQALKALSSRGWVLVRERPTAFKFSADRPDINGWTLRDGGQLWLNTRFGSSYIDF